MPHRLDEVFVVFSVHIGNDGAELIKFLRGEFPTHELLRDSWDIVTFIKDNDGVLVVNVKSVADLQTEQVVVLHQYHIYCFCRVFRLIEGTEMLFRTKPCQLFDRVRCAPKTR